MFMKKNYFIIGILATFFLISISAAIFYYHRYKVMLGVSSELIEITKEKQNFIEQQSELIFWQDSLIKCYEMQYPKK